MKKTPSCALTLMLGCGALAASAAELQEDEVEVVVDRRRSEMRQAIDLRVAAIPVARLKDDPALSGISYSAFGWSLDAAADPTRTAEITARPGTLVNGVFTPYGEDVTVLAETSGEGTLDWAPAEIRKMVYQLVHVMREKGVVDEPQLRYGYLDFTHCDSQAPQADVELAVLSADTGPILTVQDGDWPWQPIEYGVVGVGIETDASLAAATMTATTFAFRGRGTLSCEYALDGGTLEVWIDGEPVDALPAADGWNPHEISIEDYADHEVAFVYTAAGGGRTAAIRGVRWCRRGEMGTALGVRVDLRKGVRVLRSFKELMPVTYSSTNWVGDVEGSVAESKARVTVVQLAGTDPVVTNWTEVVSGSHRTLCDEPGEGEVKWKPKNGVWKAEFDILNGDESVHHEESFFDLRNTRGSGFAVMLF